MSTKDGFAISSFKMLLSVVSLVIMIPIIGNLKDVSFYVTVCVFVLGKFFELVSKILDRPIKIFFILYLIGVAIGTLAVAMCFLGFASINITNGISNTLTYNYILLGLTAAFCFIDVADFVLCVCKISYTKRRLQQFG
uniref:hypothetical protein n=1 Tax=Acetatifactor sp. TaxID=1872090 RepID=UPI004055C3FD